MLSVPRDEIAALCRRWRVTEFSLFGSAVRKDFGPDSDVDVLVRFEAEAGWSLFDLVTMQEELEGLFGRPVHLVEAEGLRNPFRRDEILRTREVVYAS
ncbi:MAG TPA: nucleotidyltransferase family protein [Phycisphaerae bacterium]|nr:nucleotidyltransferase family protein [Phycisphaerae bacterium]